MRLTLPLYARRSAIRLLAPWPRKRPVSCTPGLLSKRPPFKESCIQRSSIHIGQQYLAVDTVHTEARNAQEILPLSCPGCGAYTQQYDPNAAGFYLLTRKAVKTYVEAERAKSETEVGGDVLDGDTIPQATDTPTVAMSTPVCDRCHNLRHHHQGSPIEHPTLPAIQAIFDESPYSYNHVYHVLDAADFPMSLIPRLQEWLDLAPQRSQNRRSQRAKYHHNRRAEMSFIITRSDLLAPKKEQVDSLMPVILRILRRALGRDGQGVRLGNVRLVSSHRGWWTHDIKESVWERGGGGWMVGKVNVGKSNLFETIIPKGRFHAKDLAKLETHVGRDKTGLEPSAMASDVDQNKHLEESHDSGSIANEGLLPPRPPEVPYPVLPIVSQLPGTTVSPIRVPFGKGKGELIDLPGLDRGGLENHVLEEHRPGMVMRSRVKAKQVVIRPGQSLVISNLIRITPVTPDLTYLAYPFLPDEIEYHVCETEKAVQMLAQERNHVIKGIATPECASTIRSAGVYDLGWDVTMQRAGPLTAKDAVGISPHRLHFSVFGLDVLIESMGWIELSAQVRRKALEEAVQASPSDEAAGLPQVEVFSPNGKYVAHRETLNAWLLGGQRKVSKNKRRGMPRKSMKGAKKAAKQSKRAGRAQIATSLRGSVQ